jgi:DNA processing protein
MDDDLLYKIALTLVPHIGPVQAKILLQHCEPEEIFHAKKSFLERVEGIGSIRAESIVSFNDFDSAEEEIRFIEKNDITPLFLTDKHYPRRLLNCCDPPTLLFFKGNADLNASRMLSIIGTRNNTEYGKQMTERLVRDLAEHRVSIVSGLAFGIDIIAHKASVKHNAPTIAVLAHGLDQVYPPDHAHITRDILRNNGGLLTEFRNGIQPDKHNFPSRNRIVAGMTDATIVIETKIKGGSMITAELANGYNKDVFTVPGRVTDTKSEGCNHLVHQNKAILLTNATQIIEIMGWEEKRKTKLQQRELFIELTPDEKRIVEILQQKESVFIDDLNLTSGLSSSAVAAAILNLELQNVIVSLPGKLYRLT